MGTPIEELAWLKSIYNKLLNMKSLAINEEEQKTFNFIEAKLKRLDKLERYLVKWEEQLKISGQNTKMQVLNDIEFLINENKD